LYELPSRKDQTSFVVDADVVHRRKSLARGLVADPPTEDDALDAGEGEAETRESA